MKFVTQALTLIAATGVLSKSLKARDVRMDPDFRARLRRETEFNEECAKEGIIIDECFPDSPKNLNCSYILSERCKNFYSDPMKYLPNCKDNEYITTNLTKEQATYSGLTFELLCQVDENGNDCSLALESGDIMGVCKSEKCHNTYLTYFEYIYNHLTDIENLPLYRGFFNSEEKEEFKNEIDTLKSEQCISQYDKPVLTITTTITLKPVPTSDPVVIPEPVPTSSDPVVEPEPVPTSSDPVVEPVPTSSDPVVEPVPTSVDPVVEPVPTSVDPVVEPVPTSDPVVDPEPVPTSTDPVPSGTEKKPTRKCVIRKVRKVRKNAKKD